MSDINAVMRQVEFTNKLRAEGAAAERAAIVAMLESEIKGSRLARQRVIAGLIQRIERGDHASGAANDPA